MPEADGWQSYTTDPERAYSAPTAPGSTTVVALDGETVIALVRLQSDAEIQAHLSVLIVAEQWRRHRLDRSLLGDALKRAGGMRIGVLSPAERYYPSLGGEARPGFRLTRQALQLVSPADGPARHTHNQPPKPTTRRSSTPRRCRAKCLRTPRF